MALFSSETGFFNQFPTCEDFMTFLTSELGKQIWLELKDGAKEIRDSFRSEYVDFKNSMNPMNNSEELKSLIKQHNDSSSSEEKKMIGILIRDCIEKIESSIIMKEYNKVFGISDREIAIVSKQDEGTGRSNRGRRAKDANILFRGAEELTNATVDIHGNTAGGGGDLGIDGAFKGLVIVVLCQYKEVSEPQNRQWVRDLERKGFTVIVDDKGVITDSQLNEYLECANQVWLISGTSKFLTDVQLDTIVDKWKSGLGVYIMGDNDPFYYDANRLLEKMELPKMSGNYMASKYITKYTETPTKTTGFVDCLPMTGITSRLFEGITIAMFKLDDIIKSNCTPILYNSEGGISVIMRDAMDGYGPVVVDGAFTKLYCKYDAAGSKYLVINSACFLAADYSDSEISEPEPVHEPKIFELNYEDSLKSACQITCDEDTHVSVIISPMTPMDVDKFTSDHVLDDPMNFGKGVAIYLPPHQYSRDIATLMKNSNENPFTRQPIQCVLPMVSLKHIDNKMIIQKLISDAFMCGKNLPSAVWFLFLGACDYISGNEPDHPETWNYMIKEIVENITSTPDMSDVGEQIPLINAFHIFSQLDDMKRNRKSFTSTCIMSRIIKTYTTDYDINNLITWCRQSLIKMIVGEVLKFSKAKEGVENTKEKFDRDITSMIYESNYGIPIRGSSKTVKLVDVLKLFFTYDIVDVYKRIIGDFEIDTLLTDSMITVILYKLMSISKKDMVSFQVESLISLLMKTDYFAQIWNTNYEPEFKEILEQPHDGFHKSDDAHSRGTVFVTPYGPSVYRCECGRQFGDPTKEVTIEYSDHVKKERNLHFKDVYGSNNEGYTQDKSSHSNLHRAIQKVMINPKNQFATSLSEEHIKEVCAYLKKDQKIRGGDIFTKKLDTTMRMCIQSYLDCRIKKMKEPTKEEVIYFITKMRMEQAVILGKK